MLLGSERMPASGAVVRPRTGRGIAGLQPFPHHAHTCIYNHSVLSWPLYNAKWWLCSMLFVFCELWGAVGPVGERRCVEQPILLLSVTCE